MVNKVNFEKNVNYYFNQNVSVLLETYTALSPLDVSREIQVNTGNKKCC